MDGRDHQEWKISILPSKQGEGVKKDPCFDKHPAPYRVGVKNADFSRTPFSQMSPKYTYILLLSANVGGGYPLVVLKLFDSNKLIYTI